MEKEKRTVEQALEKAMAQLGKYVQPCNTPKCLYNPNQSGELACKSPTDSPDEDDIKKGNVENGHAIWQFYCMRFVRTSYGATGGVSAIEMHNILKNKGLIKTGSNIPTGALVFWYWKNYGHVGIYTGEGGVIHTGVNPNKKKIGIRKSPLEEITEVLDSYNNYKKPQSSYLGWAHPPEEWVK